MEEFNFIVILDSKEIKFPLGIGLPSFRNVDGVERIHRVISTKDIVNWWNEINYEAPKNSFGFVSDEMWSIVQHACTEIKAECIRFDASYLKALGHKTIKFLDLTPGDTSISYEMWGET